MRALRPRATKLPRGQGPRRETAQSLARSRGRKPPARNFRAPLRRHRAPRLPCRAALPADLFSPCVRGQKPSQFRSVRESCAGLRTEFRPFSRGLRPKSPAGLSPPNSVSRTTRWRGRSRGFAFAKLSAEEGLQWIDAAIPGVPVVENHDPLQAAVPFPDYQSSGLERDALARRPRRLPCSRSTRRARSRRSTAPSRDCR